MSGRQEALLSAVRDLNRHIRGHNISDFLIHRLEGEALRLWGGFDLAYSHEIELTLTQVSRLNLCYYFYVDLSLEEPFSLHFLPGDTAVLRFTDWGAGQEEEIYFEGGLSLYTARVPHHRRNPGEGDPLPPISPEEVAL